MIEHEQASDKLVLNRQITVQRNQRTASFHDVKYLRLGRGISKSFSTSDARQKTFKKA